MKKSDLGATTDVLTKRGWLSLQDPHFQQTVLSRVQLRLYETGQTIFNAGDPPGGIFGLVSGGSMVSVAPDNTGPHLSHIARPGWWFGEGSYLIGGPRRVSLTALTSCEIACLPLSSMKQMAAEDPDFIRCFGQIAMFNIGLSLQTISDLLLPEPEQRIAAVLWRIVGPQDGYILPVTQEQIGQLTNTSRKRTLGAIRSLIEKSALRQRYGALEIRDARLLRRVADAETGSLLRAYPHLGVQFHLEAMASRLAYG
jgi:CRP/FNR family transcriptional regulator, cyclic AMP receptor protein